MSTSSNPRYRFLFIPITCAHCEAVDISGRRHSAFGSTFFDPPAIGCCFYALLTCTHRRNISAFLREAEAEVKTPMTPV